MRQRTSSLLLWLYTGVISLSLVLLGLFLYGSWRTVYEETQSSLFKSAREVNIRIYSQLLDGSRVLDIAKQKLGGQVKAGTLTQANIHKALKESIEFFDLSGHKYKFGILYYADKTGHIHAEDGKSRDSFIDVTDRRYFTALQENPNQKWVVGDHVLGRSTGIYTFHLSTALLDANKNFLGVIFIQLPDAEFEDIDLYRSKGLPATYLVFQQDGLVSLQVPPDELKLGTSSLKQIYNLTSSNPSTHTDVIQLPAGISEDGKSYEIAYDQSVTFKTTVVAILPTAFVFWERFLPANIPLFIALGLSYLALSLFCHRLYISLNHLEFAQQAAVTDPLTTLCNRRSLDIEYPALWKNALRSGKPISVLFIDIDHFKVVNDEYGHEMGDVVLRAVSQVILLSIKRPLDLVCRWGGEEFAVVLPDTPLEGAIEVADRIMNEVRNKRIFFEGDILKSGKSINVTVSVGVSSMVVTQERITEDLIDQADKAMLQAKAEGRDCYRVYKFQ